MTLAQPARTKTKDALRNHAKLLFAERGYEGVSMRDIAGAVGIQQSAIYNHFTSKQHLLVDLLESHMHRLLGAMERAVDPDVPPPERLRQFARFHVKYQLDEPEDVFLAYMELRSLEPASKEIVIPLRDRYERTIREILQDGVSEGVFHLNDAAVVARGLLAMMTGVTIWFRDGGRLDRETVAETYVATALQAVGYQG